MKRSLLLLLFICLNGGAFAQQKSIKALEVINFKSKLLTFFTNGEKEDFGQEIKIAFYKDFVLFEVPTHHLKSQTGFISYDEKKDSIIVINEPDPDMNIEKITYMYYVYNLGQSKGLFYDEDNLKIKPFFVDTLLKHSNIGINEESLSADLGKPKEVKKMGMRVSEKYYGFKKEDGVDTIFRHYDESLKWIPISLSKKLEQGKQSKLVKSLEIICYKPSLEIKKFEPFKLEILDEITPITEKIEKAQLQKFMRYFEKYEQDLLKKPIKVQ